MQTANIDHRKRSVYNTRQVCWWRIHAGWLTSGALTEGIDAPVSLDMTTLCWVSDIKRSCSTSWTLYSWPTWEMFHPLCRKCDVLDSARSPSYSRRERACN